MNACQATLKTGKNRGKQCSYKAITDGCCRIHSKKNAVSDPKKNFNDDTECSVCYEDYDDRTHRKQTTPCGHTFCKTCLSKIDKCPLCRLKLTPLVLSNAEFEADYDIRFDPLFDAFFDMLEIGVSRQAAEEIIFRRRAELTLERERELRRLIEGFLL